MFGLEELKKLDIGNLQKAGENSMKLAENSNATLVEISAHLAKLVKVAEEIRDTLQSGKTLLP